MPNKWKRFFMEENFRQYLNDPSDFPHIYIGKRVLIQNVTSSQLTEHFKDQNNPTLSKIFPKLLNEYGFIHSEVVQMFVLYRGMLQLIQSLEYVTIRLSIG